MGRGMISVTAIQSRSEELQIPFGNMVLAYVMEELLVGISQPGLKEKWWLMNPRSFGLDSYRRKKVDHIALGYFTSAGESETLSEALIQQLLAQICQNDEKQNLNWTISIAQQKNKYQVSILANLEQVRIPIVMDIQSISNEGFEAEEHRYQLISQNNGEIYVSAYPAEQIAVEAVARIMYQLELGNAMDSYLTLYEVCGNHVLDGRKVQIRLLQVLEEKGITPDEKRLVLWQSYKNYAYMKKKWKAHLRREHRMSPSWEDVMQRLDEFITPIWKMMSEDVIFIGDWMPELGRYLE